MDAMQLVSLVWLVTKRWEVPLPCLPLVSGLDESPAVNSPLPLPGIRSFEENLKGTSLFVGYISMRLSGRSIVV